MTTQDMINAIRRGDKLGHDFLQAVADELEYLLAETKERGEKLGRLRIKIEAEEAKTFELEAQLGQWQSDAININEHTKMIQAENERLREVLKGYKSFESNLIVSEAAWSGGFAAYPTFTPELYDEWMELQGKHNAALKENGGSGDD